MKKNWIKTLMVSCLLVLACFGLCACKKNDEEDLNNRPVEETKYNIQFYLDDEEYLTKTLSEDELKNYTLPNPEARVGYVFTGWKTEDGKSFDIDSIGDNKNIKLYGKNKCYFEISDDGGLEFTFYLDLSSITELTIPETFEGKNITSISSSSFYWSPNIKTVTLHDNILAIEEGAFSSCVNLEEVNISKNSKLTKIGKNAFSGCEKLKSIYIPKNVTQIGQWAFEDCYKLETVNFDAVNCEDLIIWQEGGSYIKEQIDCFRKTGIDTDGVTLNIGSLVTKIPAGFCYNLINLVNINLKQINFSNDSICESIGALAFERCSSLKEVTIPESVNKIGWGAFDECFNLSEINYNPKNVEDMEFNKGAFSKVGENSDELILNIGESVEYLPAHIFMDNNITKIEFAENTKCTTIGEGTFYYSNNLQEISMPQTITSFGDSAFRNCDNLKEITISESVTSIGKEAFADCINLETINFNAVQCENFDEDSQPFAPKINGTNLYKVIFGAKVKCVPDNIFADTALKEVDFAENSVCESIGSGSFAYCDNLEKAEIPESVTTIGSMAFSNCSSLKKVEIPKNVLTINSHAFSYCDNLEEIYYNAIMCAGINGASPFYTMLDNAKATLYIGKDVEYIPQYMFRMAQNIKRVIFDGESKCSVIGTHAFYECANLEYVILSSQVTDIELWAFYYIDSVFSIYVLGLGSPEIETPIDEYKMYYYWENEPNENGKYWHYDTDGKTPIVWEIEE